MCCAFALKTPLYSDRTADHTSTFKFISSSEPRFAFQHATKFHIYQHSFYCLSFFANAIACIFAFTLVFLCHSILLYANAISMRFYFSLELLAIALLIHTSFHVPMSLGALKQLAMQKETHCMKGKLQKYAVQSKSISQILQLLN